MSANNRRFEERVLSLEKSLVCIAGQVNIGSDASVGTNTIKDVTVTKTATGVYTFTLAHKYPGLVSVLVTFQASTAVDLVAQVKSADPTTAGTVVVRTHAAGVATDPSAACILNVMFLFRNSNVNRG